MADWMTANEIGERYVVGPERLHAYAARGNLACRRPQNGPALFDEADVARYFRPRRGGIVVVKTPEGEHLGVLGSTKLGDVPADGANALPRGVRGRRATHSDVAPTFPGAASGVVFPLAPRKRA